MRVLVCQNLTDEPAWPAISAFSAISSVAASETDAEPQKKYYQKNSG